MPTLLATEPFAAVHAEGGGMAFCFLFRWHDNRLVGPSAQAK